MTTREALQRIDAALCSMFAALGAGTLVAGGVLLWRWM